MNKRINKREMALIVGVIIFLVALAVKSLWFDEFNPSTSVEREMYNLAIEVVADRHSTMLYSSGIMQTRIIAVKNGENGKLKIHYRKYVGIIFPFGDEYFDVE